jgi:hypothetical protein
MGMDMGLILERTAQHMEGLSRRCSELLAGKKMTKVKLESGRVNSL